MDLLLIVSVVTKLGKRMCLLKKKKQLPQGALLQRPGGLSGVSFEAAAPRKGGLGVRMGGLPTLRRSVRPTASGRPRSHPEQPRHSAGWQQIIHVGLGKWKMPWRLSLGCGVGRQPASPASLQGGKCSLGAPVAQGSQRVVRFPLQGGGEAMPAAVFP